MIVNFNECVFNVNVSVSDFMIVLLILIFILKFSIKNKVLKKVLKMIDLKWK